MKYFLGIDGGGTKTRAVLADQDLIPHFEADGGPSNFLIIGTEEVSETILRLILECAESASINYKDISGIVLGTTGAGRRSDAEKLKNAFLEYSSQKGYQFNSFEIESDARIALEGAFSGNPGCILIAGTGSIMFGKDKQGNIHRVGGFGRYIGDEGSGYSLGRKGLTCIAKNFDGREPESFFTNLFRDRFSITQSAQLITEVYSQNFDIASVAPLVIESAEKGDMNCLRIINEEIYELILHIRSMKDLLKEKHLKLCLIGGTITTENFYANNFTSKVNEMLPDVSILKAEHPPALGAALIARTMFG